MRRWIMGRIAIEIGLIVGKHFVWLCIASHTIRNTTLFSLRALAELGSTSACQG